MGRDQTFEALLAEHGAMLRRIASAYEADRERRRELEQDILLAVWRALPKHRGEAPLRAFIARVAHNRAITHVTREAAEPRRQQLDDEAPSDAPTPHETAETRDLHDRLGRAVRALPLSLTQPCAEIRRDALDDTVRALLGDCPLSPDQLTQVHLPTYYGGLQRTNPAALAPLARASHPIETGAALRQTIQRWHDQNTTSRLPADLDEVDTRDFSALSSALQAAGFFPDATGLPTETRECSTRKTSG